MQSPTQVVEYPHIVSETNVKITNDFKKLRAYLKEFVPGKNEVLLIDAKSPSKDLVFVDSKTREPLVYIDKYGVTHQCTFNDAIAWDKAQKAGNNGTVNLAANIDELRKENIALSVVQSQQNEQFTNKIRHLKLIIMIMGFVVLIFIVLLGIAFWYMNNQNARLSQALQTEQTLQTQKTNIQHPVATPTIVGGKNAWLILEKEANKNSQDHALVGTTISNPLLVGGNDLEVTWKFQGKIYQVKNRPAMYGYLLVPAGAKILLLNFRHPGIKVLVIPSQYAGISYLLHTHPTSYLEDYSMISWP